MSLPEGEKGLFTGAVRTGDAIEVNLNRRLGLGNTGRLLWVDILPIPQPVAALRTILVRSRR